MSMNFIALSSVSVLPFSRATPGSRSRISLLDIPTSKYFFGASHPAAQPAARQGHGNDCERVPGSPDIPGRHRADDTDREANACQAKRVSYRSRRREPGGQVTTEHAVERSIEQRQHEQGVAE